MEAYDLLLILCVFSILNLIFGSAKWGTFIVISVPLTLGVFLYRIKRSKPDQYLLHLLRYWMQPGYYSAGTQSNNEERMKKRVYE